MSKEKVSGTLTADGASTVVNWTGRRVGSIAAYGTFGGGTLVFQYSLDGGVTWKTINSIGSDLTSTPLSFTEDTNGLNFEAPKCKVRFSLSGATDPNIEYFISPLTCISSV
jgi:hypothetical protein